MCDVDTIKCDILSIRDIILTKKKEKKKGIVQLCTQAKKKRKTSLT